MATDWNAQPSLSRGRKNRKGLHPEQPEPLPWGRTLCDMHGCYVEPWRSGMCRKHYNENRSKPSVASSNAFGG